MTSDVRLAHSQDFIQLCYLLPSRSCSTTLACSRSQHNNTQCTPAHINIHERTHVDAHQRDTAILRNARELAAYSARALAITETLTERATWRNAVCSPNVALSSARRRSRRRRHCGCCGNTDLQVARVSVKHSVRKEMSMAGIRPQLCWLFEER